ncbi:MAG: hypothetical protein JXC85_05660 [Candidatus Aenigmarchaeota archaeon]|nr:hypothetical protein [Candidatus Aenigmarchaeota archaeon]
MKAEIVPLMAVLVALVIVSGCLSTGTDLTGKVTDVQVDTGPDSDASQARKCPATCSDGNPCTTDFCSEQTDFECNNIPLTGKACGDNSVCNQGVCEERVDNCSFIYGGGIMTSSAEEELERCYEESFYKSAVKSVDTAICDVIVIPEYLGMCYAAVAYDIDAMAVCDEPQDASSRDECYLGFAGAYAKKYVFMGEACDEIVDTGRRKECMALKDKVYEAVGVKEFYAAIVGDRIHSYLVLKDMKGRTTAADGSLTVYIKQTDVKGEEEKRLFSSTLDVKKEDFRLTPLKGFGEEDIAFVIGPIYATDFEELPSENFGTFYVTFYTSTGRAFFASEELRF